MVVKGEEMQKSIFCQVLMLIGLSVWIVAVTLIRYIFVDGLTEKLEIPVLSYIAISIGLIFLVNGFMIYLYSALKFKEAKLKEQFAAVTLIAFLYTLCLYSALVNAYIMPIFLCALVMSQLGQKRLSYISNLIIVTLISYALSIPCVISDKSVLPIVVMVVNGHICGCFASVMLSGDASRLSFMFKNLIICVASIVITMVLSYIIVEQSVLTYLPYILASAGLQFILALIVPLIVERSFNLLTNARLMELTNHRAPLVSKLLHEAPGTFNHSLAVASFAEMCASAIGENPYLARACAYYHDVGKLANPQYFKENQSDYNPHDDILPEVSAEILRSHTKDGYDLCRKYRIPEEICHVTIEHHGTMLIPVFYNKAQKLTDGTVDPYEYCYHGCTPSTKLAALVMLCDSSEAAIRAMDKPDGDKVDKLLRDLINSRLELGQFDDCEITMRELNTIRETIINAYGGLFHKRIQYPEGK